MPKKITLPKEEFIDLYINQNYSISDLCKYYHVSDSTINRTINKFNCHKPVKKINISKEELEEYYINQNHSYSETMKHFDICENSLYHKLEYYNIKKSKELIYKKVKETRENKTPEEIQAIIDKNKKHCQECFGVDNYAQTQEFKEKIKEIWKNKTPKEIQEITDKRIAYCQEHYNVDYTSQLPEVKEKVKNTCQLRFDSPYYFSSEIHKKRKATANLERYGTENVFASEYCKQKIKETNNERYGCDNPSQNPEIQKKKYETMKENGTFGKSKDEDIIYELLTKKGYTVDRQHYDRERYPWCCDFYIIELDTYIEYQGFMSHGKDGTKIYGPYDSNNPEHQLLLEKWNEKSLEHSLYESAIRTWTVVDPLKRETAKKNNLNWLEFFTIEEFMLWYNNLPENK